MSFLNKLLGRGSNEYVYLREAFANHHHNEQKEFHGKHPYAAPLLAKYNVDLKKMRKHAARVVAAAAIAGVLLAMPNRVGGPTEHKKVETTQTQSLTAGASSLSGKSSAHKPSHLVKADNSVPSGASSSVSTGPEKENPSKDKNPNWKKGHTQGKGHLKHHGVGNRHQGHYSADSTSTETDSGKTVSATSKHKKGGKD